MRVLSPGVDLDRFFARFAAASERVLFADYDGTLAPFHVRPELARPYPGVAEALDGIMAQGRTRVVMVSGRPADDLARLLPLKRRPEIWGAHGWLKLATFEEEPVVWYSSLEPGEPQVQKFEYPRGQRSYTPFVREAVRASAWLGEPPITGEEGLCVLRTIFALYQAQQSGQTQQVG